ncbi:MAG: cadherin repeat domain-containing protein, partial [Rhodobiaceae bacterium]|nr:cadherin repeat domain-containing protein [Rhodobiaceae bacterium]
MADETNRGGDTEANGRPNDGEAADELFLFDNESAQRTRDEDVDIDLNDLLGASASDDVTNPNIHMGIQREGITLEGAPRDDSIETAGASADASSGDALATGTGAGTASGDAGEQATADVVGTALSGAAASAVPQPETLVEERPDVARVAGEGVGGAALEGASIPNIESADATATSPGAATGDEENLTVQSVEEPNRAPDSISLSNTSFGENAAGAVVGTLSATDPDGNGPFTYEVNDARFEVVELNGNVQLKLKPGVSFDHEATPQVDLVITVTDEGGLSHEQGFTLTVGDENEAPTDISLSNASVAENAAGAVVGTLSTTDVDAGDTHSYAVDDARFEVVGGELKLKAGVSLDHEAADSVDVVVTTTDSGGATYSETFSIAVGDVNEAPTDIALSNSSVAENTAGAVVGTLSTTDVDAGDTHSYAVDDARFEVVGGELKLKAGVSLDHEAADSVDVVVTTTDSGGATYSETFSIAVGDVNEGPTDIALSNASVAENAAG